MPVKFDLLLLAKKSNFMLIKHFLNSVYLFTLGQGQANLRSFLPRTMFFSIHARLIAFGNHINFTKNNTYYRFHFLLSPNRADNLLSVNLWAVYQRRPKCSGFTAQHKQTRQKYSLIWFKLIIRKKTTALIFNQKLGLSVQMAWIRILALMLQTRGFFLSLRNYRMFF